MENFNIHLTLSNSEYIFKNNKLIFNKKLPRDINLYNYEVSLTQFSFPCLNDKG